MANCAEIRQQAIGIGAEQRIASATEDRGTGWQRSGCEDAHTAWSGGGRKDESAIARLLSGVGESAKVRVKRSAADDRTRCQRLVVPDHTSCRQAAASRSPFSTPRLDPRSAERLEERRTFQ